jgi:hypothetical protein
MSKNATFLTYYFADNQSVSNSETLAFNLGKNEELQLWINVLTVGQQFATVKLPIKPVEQLAIVPGN